MFFIRAAKLTQPRRWAELQAKALALGYDSRFEPTTYIRGWPNVASKPYRMSKPGGYRGSFASLDAFEAKLVKLERLECVGN